MAVVIPMRLGEKKIFEDEMSPALDDSGSNSSKPSKNPLV
jgi:hypothetical protein